MDLNEFFKRGLLQDGKLEHFGKLSKSLKRLITVLSSSKEEENINNLIFLAIILATFTTIQKGEIEHFKWSDLRLYSSHKIETDYNYFHRESPQIAETNIIHISLFLASNAYFFLG